MLLPVFVSQNIKNTKSSTKKTQNDKTENNLKVFNNNIQIVLFYVLLQDSLIKICLTKTTRLQKFHLSGHTPHLLQFSNA